MKPAWQRKQQRCSAFMEQQLCFVALCRVLQNNVGDQYLSSSRLRPPSYSEQIADSAVGAVAGHKIIAAYLFDFGFFDTKAGRNSVSVLVQRQDLHSTLYIELTFQQVRLQDALSVALRQAQNERVSRIEMIQRNTSYSFPAGEGTERADGNTCSEEII